MFRFLYREIALHSAKCKPCFQIKNGVLGVAVEGALVLASGLTS